MKRALYAAAVVILLAVIWAVGGSLPAQSGAYRVMVHPDGATELTLQVAHSGLFLDLLPGDAPFQSATVAGKGVRLVKPWPWSRRLRALTFFRGPFVMTLARGAGPFDLTGLPVIAGGEKPGLYPPPDGWSPVSHYIGQLATIQTGPVQIAIPRGMENSKEAMDRVNSLFKAAEKTIGQKPWHEPVVVLANPSAAAGARAVAEIFVPDYPAELDWWESGLTEYFAMKLMDDLKLWDNESQKEKWMRDPARGQGFRMAVWLDLSLSIDSNRKSRLSDLFRSAYSVQSPKELLAKVKELGSLTTSDTMDRMIKGRVDWPSMSGN